ncbi:MAG: acyl-CoA thioesterase [Timaviella obliquedivisa GSE-PSE-MK23-08B]|jgi:acyl-CoA thioester hydrolase|nr:acyl-CoA thioesterase [Timaviella obliquedivisa GSE-PSE-MK23-08B]
MLADYWFEYPVRVHPHQTDYAGVIWHGSYVVWLEEARVEYLRALGIEYADLIAAGCELPVVDLSIRYHRAIKMGTAGVVVKTCLCELKGVRINWDYRIESLEGLHVTARVTIVAIDWHKAKIMRQLPPIIQEALTRIPG